MDVHSLLQTGGVLALGLLLFSYTSTWFPPGRPGAHRWRALLNGALFGALAVVLMTGGMQVAPGVIVDARSVPVALIGLFEGWLAALVAAAPPLFYAIALGGPAAGVHTGGLLAVAGAAGLVHAWAWRSGTVRLYHTLTLAGLTFLATIGGFALLGSSGLAAFERAWLAYLLTYVVGIGLLARLYDDVLEQRRLAAKLQRFRAILDEASDGIRILDADRLRVLDVNRADCELSGRSREEMMGHDVREFWPREPELRAAWQASHDEAHTRGFARVFGLPYPTVTGAIVPVDSTWRVVTYQGRRYEIAIFREASERLAAEASRQEAAELRSATLLARTAAHEINNPLAIIAGYLELMEGRLPGASPEANWVRAGREAAGRIQAAVLRLNRITRLVVDRSHDGLPLILDTTKSAEARPGAGPGDEPVKPDR